MVTFYIQHKLNLLMNKKTSNHKCLVAKFKKVNYVLLPRLLFTGCHFYFRSTTDGCKYNSYCRIFTRFFLKKLLSFYTNKPLLCFNGTTSRRSLVIYCLQKASEIFWGFTCASKQHKIFILSQEWAIKMRITTLQWKKQLSLVS